VSLGHFSAIGVDVGGTFTDVIAVDHDGNIRPAKVASNIKTGEAPVLEGAAAVGVASALVFNLASTVGLNAVITRNLPKVGFLTTAGHRDTLDAGSIARPREALTDPRWRRSFGDANRPLVPRYLRRGVHERITSKGEVFIPFDEEQAREEVRLLKRCNVKGVAICLINAYVNPEHEQRLKALVREELGDIPCSVSSEINPVAREYPRATTTVIDVLMKLKYDDYTSRLNAGLADLGFKGEFNYADCRAMLMPSDYAMRRPYRLIVGGPAAGAVSSAHFGASIDDGNLICADVGGTSTDISAVIKGKPFENTAFELEPDLNISALSIDVVTLGAGGGSIVGISPTGDIFVGPDSAGADPGPAAYGRGGTRPTTTDTALLAGILAPNAFLGGRMALHPALSLAAFEALDTPMPLGDRVQQAWAVAVDNIAEGILNISIRRGIDPRDFSLMAYGAAGPMVLPAILDVLDMRRVIVPPYPGLFSALGLVSSDLVFMDQRSAYLGLEAANAGRIDEIYRTIEKALVAQLSGHEGRFQVKRSFDAQLIGQSFVTPLIEAPNGTIDPDAIRNMRRAFHDAYELRNGNRFEAHPVEGVTYRVQAVVPMEKVRYPVLPARPANEPLREIATRKIAHIYGGDVDAKVYARTDLRMGDTIDGPAIIMEEMSTTLVPPGRKLDVGRLGELVVA
jgi:N-methylhydantoinase A